MKALWSKRLFAIAGAGALAMNAILVTMVAYNRSGPPESVLRLGGRELNMLPASSMVEEDLPELLPRWRILSADGTGGHAYGASDVSGLPIAADPPAWLGGAKLRELGAALPSEGPEGLTQRRRLTRRPLMLEALLVLELDGDAYRQSLERARTRAAKAAAAFAADPRDERRQREASNADKALAEEEGKSSRLFAVDAGVDAGALRAKYPARDRYAIVPGRIMVMLVGPDGQQRVAGSITGTNADRVSVPAEFRSAVEGLRSDSAGASGTVDLAFGRRLEPWIRGVSIPP